jgi:hypothetical protein
MKKIGNEEREEGREDREEVLCFVKYADLLDRVFDGALQENFLFLIRKRRNSRKSRFRLVNFYACTYVRL